MFFNADQTNAAQGAVIPEKAPSGPEQNRNLSPKQFGPKGGPAEAEGGAAGAEAGAGAVEGAAGAGELAELAPLLLL